MKKLFLTFLVTIFLACITINVNAKEVYYTTANGIKLSEEEYTFLTTFYWQGYPDVMTQADYNQFVRDDIFHSDVTIKTNEPTADVFGPTRSDSYETSAKRLQIGKACLPTKCYISLVNTWLIDPSVTSWDVIGAYLDGVELKTYSHTYVSTANTTTYFDNLQTESDGLGNSVNLPDAGTDMIINMAFTVSRGGTVYGSYQHAMTDTTLANSKLYHIDFSGYGNVFDFYGTADEVYDQMNGVDVDV